MATARHGDADRTTVGAASLEGRVALVTGGGVGLGRQLALGLADAGAMVAVVGDTGREGSVADEISADGHRSAAVPCDLTAPANTSAAFRAVVDALGPLDAVVHAYVDPAALRTVPLADTDETAWDTRCEALLRAALACCQAAFASFDNRAGRLVFVTPTIAMTGAAGLVPYATAIEGIRAMAKSAARQWGEQPITVNCVAPPVELVLPDGPRVASDPTVGEAALGRAPDGRADVAPLVAMLAGEAAHFLTGATIAVDGGIVMAP